MRSEAASYHWCPGCGFHVAGEEPRGFFDAPVEHRRLLSLDPYMRGRMNDVKSYVPPVRIGQTMEGGAVSVVEESRHPDYCAGDIVYGRTGWQRYAISSGKGMRKVDPSIAPISTALGILGMPGLTGYVGLLDLGQPKDGETVVVSAATGAVGALVGQIGKLKGCRVVGVAGAREKCRYAVDTLGLDVCVSHRDPNLADALKEACPDGVDINRVMGGSGSPVRVHRPPAPMDAAPAAANQGKQRHA